jgi:hypothetical protein
MTKGFAYGLAIQNDYAYVANFREGLRIVDIRDPLRPLAKGRVRSTGLAQGVSVRGEFAYFTDTDAGLVVVDVTDPNAPARGVTVPLPFRPNSIFLSESHLYIAGEPGGFLILSLEDPARPRFVGSTNARGGGLGVAVNGKTAWIAHQNVDAQIVDVSNPEDPRVIGQVSETQNARGIAFSGRYTFLSGRGFQVVPGHCPATPIEPPAMVQAGESTRRMAILKAAHPVRIEFPRDFSGKGIEIIDSAGRKVRSLPGTGSSESIGEASWDGRDEAGRTVPQGIYFARIPGGRDAANSASRRILVIR